MKARIKSVNSRSKACKSVLGISVEEIFQFSPAPIDFAWVTRLSSGVSGGEVKLISETPRFARITVYYRQMKLKGLRARRNFPRNGTRMENAFLRAR